MTTGSDAGRATNGEREPRASAAAAESPSVGAGAPSGTGSGGHQTESISHIAGTGTGIGPVERASEHDKAPQTPAAARAHDDHLLSTAPAPGPATGSGTLSASKQLYPRAGRGDGPARFGGMGELGLKERQTAPKQVTETRQRADSQSIVGTGYRSFMNMISALAQEDQDNGDDEAASTQPPMAEHWLAGGDGTSTEDSADDSATRLDTARLPSSTPHEPLSTSRVSVSSVKGSQTAAGGDSDDNDGTPPSFLSPPVEDNLSTHEDASDTLNYRTSTEDEREDDLVDQDASSSIHAIHRPIAARRRTLNGEPGEAAGPEGTYIKQGLSDQDDRAIRAEPESFLSEEEEQAKLDLGRKHIRPMRERSETVVSRRSITRRAKLAEKLGDVFGIGSNEAVIAEFPCWLFRSILLQGFAFLTTGHLCFYAYLQKKEASRYASPLLGSVERSGAVSCRGSKTRRYFRHWFVLKDDVLSWYPSSTDPYFPDGHIDLHYCTSVEPSTKHKHHFKVSTADKRWHFGADSEASRDEWVKALKKAVFRCQNEGESVKISIPLETVIDIERSHSFEFAETIRVRVFDAEEGYSVDEYWFSYFQDTDRALRKMRGALEDYRIAHPEAQHDGSNMIRDSTERAETTLTTRKDAPASQPTGEGEDFPLARGSSLSPVESRTFQKGESANRKSSSLSTSFSNRLRIFPPAQMTHNVSADGLASSAATLTDKLPSGTATPREASVSSAPAQLTGSHGPSDLRKEEYDDSHRYPPSIPPTDRSRSQGIWIPAVGSTLGAGASWLKHTLVPHASTSSAASGRKKTSRKIVEVVSGSNQPLDRNDEETETRARQARTGDMSRSVWDEHDSVPGQEAGENEHEEDDGDKVNEKFRKHFGLTDKESVVAYYPGYLFRGLPIYGKIYVSTTFLCFKSNGILAKTKMILPLADIINLSKHRSYRIGYSGLVVTIKGHEELFFELAPSSRRDECMSNIESQSDFVQRQLAEGKTPGDTLEHQQHLELLDLAASKSSEKSTDGADLVPPPENIAGQPPVMFCSTSSDFVTFRPEKALRFTCLTIGSRGDVQPYIALCKGLMAEGHSCTIASHAEYRNWVEGHGIQFAEVGGDPADLMELMIAHDFFTISFMKEAIGRFRGWLDDLLESAWHACQNTDVLIESPSAIAGYHIAEALRIPYYRAFTMTWTRTRAYPHAFAVPEVKMGGGYNFMTYTMFDQVFWRAMSGQVNRWRKKTLGLNSTNLELMQQHKIPFLYNFSPTIVPPPLDWRENIHVTGYWYLDNPDDSSKSKWEPPQDLLDFLDKAKRLDKKVVFIGFGSIIIPDPEEMTRIVTEAVSKADVYAIVAKGWSDRSKSKTDSEETKREIEEQERKEAQIMKKDYIYNIKSIPHDWLFPKIHAAVHHGGAGTTGASLRAGLPTIIKPFFGDQYFYADRVATLGIGSCIRNMTVDNLANAIKTAVSDEKQIARAKLTGDAIRKEDGVGNAIECIYRDLEYARSLIPPPPKLDRTASNMSGESGSTKVPPSLSMQALSEQSSRASAASALMGARASTKQGGSTGADPPRDSDKTGRHERQPSGSRTNPNSSSDEWDVVSQSQSVTGDGDVSRSTRWDEDSSAGWTSRSRSQSRGGRELTANSERGTTVDTTTAQSQQHSNSITSSAAAGLSKVTSLTTGVTGGLTTAVLEAFGRKEQQK
ncbi:Sterol 3-beta-glucosyltransferase [Microbotryomycetes sp. JL201]|nr:Sterol 3-beta-glucosyltransferase [Microbotryomycetes sp. JL201]